VTSFSEALITITIPVRIPSEPLYDEVARLERIIETVPPDTYAVVIVDDGSAPAGAAALRGLLDTRNNVDLIRIESEREAFSIGRARDAGAQHARTPLVLFHDLDLIASAESYRRIALEARLRGMPDNAYEFVAVSAAWLSEGFSQEYIRLHAEGDAEFADFQVHDAIQRPDRSKVTFMTYASSAILVHRRHLLSVGGHDRGFTGHGGEDFDLMHRLSSYGPRAPRPQNYYEDTRSNQVQKYKGFRAFFAVYGLESFNRGLVLAHLWHPVRMDATYRNPKNRARTKSAFAEYDASRKQPFPLPDLSCQKKSLALFPPGSDFVDCVRQAIPLLGACEAKPATLFETPELFLTYLQEEGVQHVLMHNPYGNRHRLALYNAAREAGVEVITFERGALPDSWFFDAGGFLCDSTSYQPCRWDRSLGEHERQETLDYIGRLRSSDQTLEWNGTRRGANHWRDRLNVRDRKVIFVSMQRPLDTVTRFFAGACGSVAGFHEWLEFVAAALDKRRFAILAKKHPLETEKPNIPGVTYVPDDCHIHDLLELADAVFTMNSGTGVLALGFGKPVVCASDAFYAHAGLAQAISSPEDALAVLRDPEPPDFEKVLRFFRHLVFNLYSFGHAETSIREGENGSLQNVARRIVFREIRGLTPEPVIFGKPPRELPLDSPIFFPFGGKKAIEEAIVANKNAKTEKAAARPEASSVEAPQANGCELDDLIRRDLRYRAFATAVWPLQSRRLNRKLREKPSKFFQDAKSPLTEALGQRLLRLQD
jgi:predicted glycosyltransferase involved in capsule biosynthesis